MPSAVISDASCLIILHKIGSIELLRQTYTEITTTPEIDAEVGFHLPDWVNIRRAKDPESSRLMPGSIDAGEASAIALALEIPGATIIIDDRAARNYAKRLGLNVTGTLGVIVKAKLDGVVPSIEPYVSAIRQTDFRFSADVEADAYQQANESKQ
jgi:predicted nucleic acid-binding protein